MSAYVIWLDGEHAKIFKMLPGKVETQALNRKEIRHHTSSETANHKNHDKFFHELAGRVNDASEILLIGPGLAKTQFKHHLEQHHHAALAAKVVGIETVDHPTEGEVLARARKFFKAHDLFV